jgi:hypothetical protein
MMSYVSSPFELPQIEPDGFERADAARNRERILCGASARAPRSPPPC